MSLLASLTLFWTRASEGRISKPNAFLLIFQYIRTNNFGKAIHHGDAGNNLLSRQQICHWNFCLHRQIVMYAPRKSNQRLDILSRMNILSERLADEGHKISSKFCKFPNNLRLKIFIDIFSGNVLLHSWDYPFIGSENIDWNFDLNLKDSQVRSRTSFSERNSTQKLQIIFL